MQVLYQAELHPDVPRYTKTRNMELQIFFQAFMHIVWGGTNNVKYDCPDKQKPIKLKRRDTMKPEHEKHCKCKQCSGLVAGHEHDKKHPGKSEKCDK